MITLSGQRALVATLDTLDAAADAQPPLATTATARARAPVARSSASEDGPLHHELPPPPDEPATFVTTLADGSPFQTFGYIAGQAAFDQPMDTTPISASPGKS